MTFKFLSPWFVGWFRTLPGYTIKKFLLIYCWECYWKRCKTIPNLFSFDKTVIFCCNLFAYNSSFWRFCLDGFKFILNSPKQIFVFSAKPKLLFKVLFDYNLLKVNTVWEKRELNCEDWLWKAKFWLWNFQYMEFWKVSSFGKLWKESFYKY